jgi:hypothetical protein
MIIDAKTDHHPSYRNYSEKGAVAYAIEPMQAGDTIKVEKAVDADGHNIGLLRVQINISNLRGNRQFKTRAGPAPLLATIHRLA